MNENDKGKLKQLSTYLYEKDNLYRAVRAEAEATGLSISDIIRLSLAERQERKRAEND